MNRPWTTLRAPNIGLQRARLRQDFGVAVARRRSGAAAEARSFGGQGRRRLQLILAFCALTSISCATGGLGSSPSLQSSLPVVSSQAFSSMIMPRLVNFVDSWTPTEQQVLLAEPKVQACVLGQRHGLRSTLSLFVRHYSGWTVDGRQTLRVQFYDSRHFTAEELAHPSEVVDSDGVTYFVMSFDIGSGTCAF